MTSRETLRARRRGAADAHGDRGRGRAAARGAAGRARRPRPLGLVAIVLSIVALARRRRSRSRDWVVIDAAGGLMVGVIGLVGLASALVSPPTSTDAVGLFGARARRRAPTTPRWRRSWPCSPPSRSRAISARRGCSSRRRPPPRRSSSASAASRARSRPAGSTCCSPRSGSASRCSGSCCSPPSPRAARSTRSRGARSRPTCRRGRRRSSRSCWSSSDSPPRSAGRPCTTGSPTRTPRRRRPSRRCSPPRSFRPCCSSPGASSGRSSPRSARARARTVLIGFGLVSLAVAVPFLWRPLAWKRLLAYSSLEHMGVIALGIGFATPLALAGRRGAHRRARGRQGARLLRRDAAARARAARAGHAVTGIARTQPALGATMGISLGALAGLPPSPLFLSEILIIAAASRRAGPGRQPAPRSCSRSGSSASPTPSSRRPAAAPAVASGRRARAPPRVVLGAVATPILLALAGAAFWLPDTDIVEALVRGSDDRPRRASLPRRGRRRSPAAPGSRGSTHPRAGACPRASSPGRHVVRLESVARDGRSRPDDRRPRAGRRLGRARGTRPLRRALRRARAAAAARRPRPVLADWTVPVRGRTRTRSRSGRSTPA